MITPLILRKISFDLKQPNPRKAADRLEGLLSRHPENNMCRQMLGEIYSGMGELSKAGRYFYFKENRNDIEQTCVEAFQRSLGNDPVLILKKLLNKYRFAIRKTDVFTQRELYRLLLSIHERDGFIPNFAAGLWRYFVSHPPL